MSPANRGRALAITAGCAFAAGGLTILLGKDLMHPLDWAASQWLTILTVFGTIAAGHLMVDAARARHVFATLGFLVLFLSGTGLVVYSSVGRQVETAGVNTLTVEDTNRQIADKTTDLKAARARRDYANAQSDREMTGSRCGRRCRDWKTNAADIGVVIHQLEAEIAALGPQKPANAKADAMADIVLLFPVPASKPQVVALLTLLVPFLTTLFFEIGIIVSLGFAFRTRQLPQPANDCQTFSGRFPEPPKPRKAIKRLPENVVSLKNHPAIRALENAGGTVSSNRELASLMAVTEGEASKRVREIEHLVNVRKVGKQVTITLKKAA